MSDLQRDIEAIDELVRGGWSFGPEQVSAWQRIRARLTPDRERVFAAITETLIRFGHDDATMLQDCIFAADAAIAAAVPEGYALVPVEPTEAMVQAAFDSLGTYCREVKIRRYYRAMLAAAERKGES